MGTQTYTLIQEQVLTSSAASVTFSSIPQIYEDLVLEVSASGASALPQGVAVRINNDGGNNYSDRRIFGDGSSASSSYVSNFNWIYSGLFALSSSGSTANPGILTANFMSYSNTNVNKTVLFRGSAASSEVSSVVGLWRSTAAITSIRLLWTWTETFAAGSTFRLYGLVA